MTRQTTQRAFAKLNLSLDVLARRPDGYHDLRSVMQSVDLCDEVDITIMDTPKIRVRTDRPDLPTDCENLAGKAAKLFLERTGLSGELGAEIYITKRIPDRAGLAGGSSDAAAVLRAMDALLNTNLTDRELYGMCLALGSDVPFCLYGGTALAEGRGEVLTDLPPIPDCGILIVKPDFSVSTPVLFTELDKRGFVNSTNTDALLNALLSDPTKRGSEWVPGPLGNVFKEALPPLQRGVVEGVESALLNSGAAFVTMTGTGSAVFGVFPTLAEARQADLTSYGTTFAASPVKRLQRPV